MNNLPLEHMNLPIHNRRTAKIERQLTKKRKQIETLNSSESASRQSDGNNTYTTARLDSERMQEWRAKRKVNQFSPSSPIRSLKELDKKHTVVPFLNVHKKTYFKTIENVLQNENNKTRKKFAKELDKMNSMKMTFGQALIDKVRDMQSDLLEAQGKKPLVDELLT